MTRLSTAAPPCAAQTQCRAPSTGRRGRPTAAPEDRSPATAPSAEPNGRRGEAATGPTLFSSMIPPRCCLFLRWLAALHGILHRDRSDAVPARLGIPQVMRDMTLPVAEGRVGRRGAQLEAAAARGADHAGGRYHHHHADFCLMPNFLLHAFARCSASEIVASNRITCIFESPSLPSAASLATLAAQLWCPSTM